ncbi:MAG: B12-binding domain-containing radical SAM protein [Archangiaceae bacterium]|nr:B12-binding domain-containing radical SAM protein [Archangiaceae bacterium]
MSAARRVALLCIDPWLKTDGPFRPFNYPVRRIEAALETSHAEVRIFEAQVGEAESLLPALEAFDPDLVGASAYTWSFAALLELSSKLKARRPERRVVFGGPSARPEMFSLEPYREAHRAVDALVLGEGEDIVRELVTDTALSEIAGLALPDAAGGFTRTAERALPDLHQVPSPYQRGLVPKGFTAHLETFRGCPLSCRFCQWGDLSKTNRTFSREYLVAELTAFRDTGATGAFIVDAALNLNARAFQSLAAAEAEVGFLRTAHFNTEIYPSHMTDEHLRFLRDVEADNVGIGLQSYDPEVLRHMQRPFDAGRFEKVVRDVAAIVPDTVVEIIFGLPGDNRDSFWRTLERVRQLPVAVRIYRCLVLPNALMTRAPEHFAMRFDPRTLLMQSCWGWPEEDLERTARELDALVSSEGGDVRDGSGSWKVAPRGRARASDALPALAEPLGRALREHSSGAWVLERTSRDGDAVLVQISTPAGALLVEMRPQRSGRPSYCTADGVAFSYRSAKGAAVAPASLQVLQRAAPSLAAVVAPVLGSPS